MPDTSAHGIGGWIKSAENSRKRINCPLSEIDPAGLNPEYLSYFRDYRRRYFNDRLHPKQGAEEILAMLRDHGGQPARWIDLGAGVTTLFWSIGVNSPGEITACDVVPEALHVLCEFKEGEELPPCYEDALSLVGKTREELGRSRNLDWNYRVIDCLAPWACEETGTGYDLITAIGCFGLSPGTEAYSAAFQSAADNLAPSGRMIGADWIRSGMFIEMEGHDNRYLDKELIEASARSAGLGKARMQRVSIEGDPYYDAVIVWAFGH